MTESQFSRYVAAVSEAQPSPNPNVWFSYHDTECWIPRLTLHRAEGYNRHLMWQGGRAVYYEQVSRHSVPDVLSVGPRAVLDFEEELGASFLDLDVLSA